MEFDHQTDFVFRSGLRTLHIANITNPDTVVKVGNPIHGHKPFLLIDPGPVDQTDNVALFVVVTDGLANESALLLFQEVFKDDDPWAGALSAQLLQNTAQLLLCCTRSLGQIGVKGVEATVAPLLEAGEHRVRILVGRVNLLSEFLPPESRAGIVETPEHGTVVHQSHHRINVLRVEGATCDRPLLTFVAEHGTRTRCDGQSPVRQPLGHVTDKLPGHIPEFIGLRIT